MLVELTPEEAKLAERLILQRERTGNSWTWLRWFLLALGIFVACAGFWATVSIVHSLEDLASSPQLHASTQPKWAEYESSSVRFECRALMTVIISWLTNGVMAIGVAMAVAVAFDWNSHKVKRLEAKFLRALLAEASDPLKK